MAQPGPSLAASGDLEGSAPAAGPATARAVRLAAAAVVLLGIVVRVAVYLARRPLWSDEAMVSLNIASRGFAGLLRPMAYDQTAPVLFLWGERLATRIGGVNEYALRFIPIVCGCLLLVLLWRVTRELLGEREALVATLLAAVSTFLIYHSSEVKQYGTDACFTMVLLAAALPVFRDPSRGRAWWLLTAAGALVLLASQPSVFILAGIGVALLASPRVRAAPGWFGRCAVAALLWVAVFVVLYLSLYRATATSWYMVRFWHESYLTPGAPGLRLRLMRAAANVLVSPFMPTPRSALAGGFLLAFLAGIVALARRRDPWRAALVLVPFAAFLAANVAGAFPFASRLLLFLAPLTFIVYGAAVAWLVDRAPARLRGAALAAAVVLLLAWRGTSALAYALHPPRIEDTRGLIAALQREDGGAPVYVFANGAPAWVFYTTDWSAPDTARLAYMARMESSTGPAFGNRPSRHHAVGAEGDSLFYDYRGRREILGVGSGGENHSGEDRAESLPDSGWGANEIRRLRAAAHPYGWVYIAAQAASEVEALRAAGAAAGATMDRYEARSQALIYRLRFPGG